MRQVQSGIIRMVAYFDMFDHPLATAELTRLLAPGEEDLMIRACGELADKGVISEQDGFWFRAGRADTLPIRAERVAYGTRAWNTVERSSRILAELPFVRGVFLTGSLSKGCSEPQGDVDFLLLVEPGRVWCLKSMTEAVRKVAPVQIRRTFCTNYLRDLESLDLQEKNLFTAVELATAVPMYGPRACTSFLESNRWAETFVPGWRWSEERAGNARHLPSRRAVNSLERWFHGAWADRVEGRLMERWDAYWEHKYGYLDDGTRKKSFRREVGVATNHLTDFQGKVLSRVAKTMAELGVSEPVVWERT